MYKKSAGCRTGDRLTRVRVVRVKGHRQKTETERGRNSTEGRAQRESMQIKKREKERRQQLKSAVLSEMIMV